VRKHSYDQSCYDLAESFLCDCEGGELVNDSDRSALAQAIQEVIEDFVGDFEREFRRTLEPCTSRAIACGCICRMQTVNTATIDPPEPIISRNCPLHGNAPDPDYALEAKRDEAAES
jgi:hypothetical protein